MKKISNLLFILILIFGFTGCSFTDIKKNKINSKLEELITNYEVDNNLNIPSQLEVFNKTYDIIITSSNEEIAKIMKEDNYIIEITKSYIKQEVQIKTDIITEDNEIISKTYFITILEDPILVAQVEDEEYINNYLNEFEINKELTENFNVPSKVITGNNEYDIEWISSNQEIIYFEKEENSYNVFMNRALDDKEVQLKAIVCITEDIKIKKTYEVLVKQSLRAEGLKEEFVKWHNNRDSEASEKLTKENVFVSYLYYMDENIIVCNLNNEVHHFLGIYEPWKCEGLEFNMAGLVYFVWDGNNLYEIDVAYNKGLISKDILSIVHKNIYPQFYE